MNIKLVGDSMPAHRGVGRYHLPADDIPRDHKK
jgi:hypothetical protein